MNNLLKDILENVDGTREMINTCLDLVSKSNGIVIFGAGVGGKCLYNLLEQHKLEEKIIAYSDNNNLKWNKEYMRNNIRVIPPKHIINHVPREGGVIVVASSAYDVIVEQLVQLGCDRRSIYLYNFAFMDLEYTDKDFILDHLVDFQRTYERMADEKSKEIFTNILNYKITKNIEYLHKLQNYIDDEKNQYFPEDLIKFVPEEIFVDIGAYTGDTLDSFINHYGVKKWKKYYGLEADKIVCDKLYEYVQNHQLTNKTVIYNKAAWDKEETLFFTENAGDSSMHKDFNSIDENAIDADCIDNILGEDTKITFVKMDIEGAEYNAICGMRKLLQKNKPVIAVCAYHKRDDYFKLTDLIEEIVPHEYTYFMRQYRYTPTETVIYAIPRKRII